MSCKRLLSFLLIAGLFCIPSVLQAETMLFVTGGMSPPYVYEESGQIRGMDVDVIKKFCAANDITPKFEAYPWKRSLMLTERGGAHGIFSLFRTDEREKFLYYPDVPINHVKTVVIGLRENNYTVNSLEDLKGHNIGVISGYKYGPDFDEMEGLNKSFCKDKRELITMLDRGRVDVTMDAEAVFWFKVNEYGFDPDKFEILHVVTSNPIYVGFSQPALGERGKVLADKFETFFNTLKENGSLKEIRSQYQ